MADVALYLASLGLIAAGFFGIGAGIGRLIGSPAPLLTAFIGSALALFLCLLGCDALHVSLRGPAVLVIVGTTALVLLIAGWRSRPAAAATSGPRAWFGQSLYWPWLLPIMVGFASVIIRAVVDPLSGYDTEFRWDHISRLMLSQGTLGFYPPVTAEDFRLYPWCDGIPPLVSILDYWLYRAANHVAPVLTAVRVGTEFTLLAVAVHGYAREIWQRPAAGWAAVAALMTSSILLWGVAMGQETGLTALSVVTLLWFLERYHRHPATATAIWAGAAAALGALSREYGLAFIVLGAVILLLRSKARQGLVAFTATAVALAVPWYARNAAKTGNPFYNQDLVGLFPINRVQAAYMHEVAAYWSPFGNGGFGLSALALTTLALAGPLLGLAVFGMMKARDAAKPIAAALVLVVALWLWSVGQTAGGWTYSMRVLTPVLSLAAVLAGWMGTLRSVRVQTLLAVLLLPLCADAARRAWHLPQVPFVSPFSTSFSEWRKWRDITKAPDPTWPAVVAQAGGEGIIVDHPLIHVRIVAAGGRAIPWWSPEAAPIFDRSRSFADVLQTLRTEGVRFIAMTPDVPVNRGFVGSVPFLTELRRRQQPVGSIYDLKTLAAAAAGAAQKSFLPPDAHVASPTSQR